MNIFHKHIKPPEISHIWVVVACICEMETNQSTNNAQMYFHKGHFA